MITVSRIKKKQITLTLEYALAFCLILFVFLSDFQEVTFHYDESHWIGTSLYFDAILAGDFSDDTWTVSHATLTQPPLARYVIGVGRLIGGLPASELNTIWDYSLSDVENADAGAIPSDELLFWSRLPMKILASVSIMLGFYILRKIGGRIPGYIWIILCLISHYFFVHLSRAMSEAPVLLFVSLILIVSYFIVDDVSQRQKSQARLDNLPSMWRRTFIYFAILGIIIGLAGAVKFNGLSALAAGVVLAVVAVVKSNLSKTLKFRYALILIWIMLISALVIYFVVNPFLWRDPFHRQSLMFSHRIYIMGIQQQEFVESAIHGLSDRVLTVGESIFNRYASLQFPGSTWVNLVFMLVGLTYVIIQFINFFRDCSYNPAAMIVLIVGFFTAGPSLLTPLDWDRYYLFPVFFTTMMICIGIWQGVLFIGKWIRNHKSKQQPGKP